MVNLIQNYSQTYTQYTLLILRKLSTISLSEENRKRIIFRYLIFVLAKMFRPMSEEKDYYLIQIYGQKFALKLLPGNIPFFQGSILALGILDKLVN